MRHRSWRREWPLLAGMAVSAAVAASSTLVAAAPAPIRQPAPSPSSTAATLGAIVDTGAAPARPSHAKAPAPTKKHAGERPRKQHRRKAVKPVRSTHHGATPTSTPAPTTTPAPSATSTPTPTPTATPTPTPAHSEPVQVTGTDAKTIVGPVTFTMSASSHTPKVDDGWTLTVTAMRAGRPVDGRVHADVLFEGSPVRVMDNGRLDADGYRHHLTWPKESRGYPLTVRVDATAGGQRQVFLFDLQVRDEPAPAPAG
jgi:hypothetical protein